MVADKDIKKEALKNGLIWALINIVLFTVTWYVMPELMSSYFYSGFLFLVGIGLAIFFTLDMRKKAGGYWTFGDALWKIFAMFIVSTLITYTYNIAFGKVIDPSYPVKMKELVLEKTKDTFKSLNVDGDTADEALEKTAQNLDEQFSPTFSQAVRGFGISTVFYFVGALIFAAIFKKTNDNPWANSQTNNEETAQV